jgi:ubiquinone/menaquinone biosynthesis C-methylase UbiE
MMGHMGRSSRLRSFFYRIAALLQKYIVPGLTHSQEKYRELLREKIEPRTRWLDVGCGHHLFAPWLSNSLRSQMELVARCERAVGVDCGDDRSHVVLKEKLNARAEKLPFESGSFSVVTANMVLEHFENPAAAFSEIYRVLRPGGLFIFHTPNAKSPWIRVAALFPYCLEKHIAAFIDGRDHDDIFPAYYRANDARSVHNLASAVGFQVSSFESVDTSPILVMLGPAVVFELLAIRLLRHPAFARLRPDLLVVLEKPGTAESMLAAA